VFVFAYLKNPKSLYFFLFFQDSQNHTFKFYSLGWL
jgi:hypothetical protein